MLKRWEWNGKRGGTGGQDERRNGEMRMKVTGKRQGGEERRGENKKGQETERWEDTRRQE